MRKPNSRARRLCLWFSLNLIVFLACYLNYLLQPKHRYLYRTLNVGLCLSRAAAMVINLNLLLVWLPMCKYTLTRLASLANRSLRCHRRLQLVSHLKTAPISPTEEGRHHTGSRLVEKLELAARQAVARLRGAALEAKVNAITSFTVAVDHCKALHTICATTITIASVVHTVAHLMNVVNFSRNYDPFLGSLNMAEYRGQSPLHLLISVPGITGILMVIILLLMSLSSVDFIRNSSYDLFQIFHRLSILFVILLFIHPASHVIKEQSNVDRHHPDVCYSMLALQNSSLAPAHPTGDRLNATSAKHKRAIISSPTTTTTTSLSASRRPPVDGQQQPDLKHRHLAHNHSGHQPHPSGGRGRRRPSASGPPVSSANGTREPEEASRQWHRFCRDPRPLFVAQSSVCWYVLSVGLSCYLIDLLVRRLRRSRSSLELLEVRLDGEQNLMELVLSNNHRRFADWQPGQFVYLSCPQIARHQWHPFTISSMDQRLGCFTLHIKTAGDWTRKLRDSLGSSHNSIAAGFYSSNKALGGGSVSGYKWPLAQLQVGASVLPSLDCYTRRGGLEVQCTRLVCKEEEEEEEGSRVKIDLENTSGCSNQEQRELYCISGGHWQLDNTQRLDLYVDGPFHSPFERLLEQQVSVCLANGVGWTAFSSIFQHLLATDNDDTAPPPPRNYGGRIVSRAAQHPPHQASARLHLMVVVASIEQLRPFYSITLSYFAQTRAHRLQQGAHNDHLNPVKEVTAFVTRATALDMTVREFCLQEGLELPAGPALKVTDSFSVRFGKPCFEAYLKSCAQQHPDSPKISVYCCGSYQVKRDVRRLCKSLNRLGPQWFAYHEENF